MAETEDVDSLVQWSGADGSSDKVAVVQMTRPRNIAVSITPYNQPTPTPLPGTIFPTSTPIPTLIPPHVLRGSVTIGGSVAVEGTLVEAWVGDFKARLQR